MTIVALLSIGVGAAAADPVTIKEVTESKNTADGWTLEASLPQIIFNPVPNIDTSAVSREVYVTGTAKLAIRRTDGLNISCNTQPPAIPDPGCIKSATIRLSVQLGCQLKVGEGSFESNPTFADSFSNLTVGNVLSLFTGGTLPTSNTLGIAPTVNLNPQTTVRLSPGAAQETSLGSKAVGAADSATSAQDPNSKATADELTDTEKGGGTERVISAQNFQVKIEGCAGPIFGRMIAKTTMGTGHSNDEVDAYSDTIQL